MYCTQYMATLKSFATLRVFLLRNGVVWNWLPKDNNSMLSNAMNVLNSCLPSTICKLNITKN